MSTAINGVSIKPTQSLSPGLHMYLCAYGPGLIEAMELIPLVLTEASRAVSISLDEFRVSVFSTTFS